MRKSPAGQPPGPSTSQDHHDGRREERKRPPGSQSTADTTNQCCPAGRPGRPCEYRTIMRSPPRVWTQEITPFPQWCDQREKKHPPRCTCCGDNDPSPAAGGNRHGYPSFSDSCPRDQKKTGTCHRSVSICCIWAISASWSLITCSARVIAWGFWPSATSSRAMSTAPSWWAVICSR